MFHMYGYQFYRKLQPKYRFGQQTIWQREFTLSWPNFIVLNFLCPTFCTFNMQCSCSVTGMRSLLGNLIDWQAACNVVLNWAVVSSLLRGGGMGKIKSQIIYCKKCVRKTRTTLPLYYQSSYIYFNSELFAQLREWGVLAHSCHNATSLLRVWCVSILPSWWR